MNKIRLVFALLAVFAARGIFAATVTAELSADETSVGMPVQLQVRVEGTTNVILPDIAVDGLAAQRWGRSVQASIDMTRGRVVTSGVYFCMIVPTREGTFDIPPLEIITDGKKQRTPALKLVVQAGSAGAPRPAAPLPLPPPGSRSTQGAAPPSGDDRIAYAEMIVPRESIYAGELVPVEIRFYFKDGIGFQLAQRDPQVNGEGFTMQKFSPPKQTQEIIGDASYQVLSFKTALTAVKSGEMALPKVSLQVIARVPSKGPRGMDDLFSQFFGNQGMPGFTDDREMNIESQPTRIRVKALPVAGRPEGFSGAVGEFTLAASADPLKVAAGDPVTLKTAISGRGNFDAMGGPKLAGTDGWRVYPPTDKFEPSDVIGYAGTKTFEMPLVAQRPQTRTPVAEFSYFDPIKEKYATIKSQPVAITAAAGPEATAAAPAAATPGPQPSATPARDAAGSWLAQTHARSWEPLVRNPAFWVANGIAALALVGLAAMFATRRSRQGVAGQRAAAVRHRDRLLEEMSEAGLADEAFFAKAHEALAVQARLANEIGPFEFVRGLEGRGRETTELRAILAQADEIKFSGGRAAALVDADARRRVVNSLREVCR